MRICRRRPGVAGHPHGYGGLDQIAEFEPLAVGLFGQEFEHILHGRAQFEVEDFQFYLAGLNFGKIQDVVDNRQQCLAGAVYGLGVLALFRCQCCIE